MKTKREGIELIKKISITFESFLVGRSHYIEEMPDVVNLSFEKSPIFGNFMPNVTAVHNRKLLGGISNFPSCNH